MKKRTITILAVYAAMLALVLSGCGAGNISLSSGPQMIKGVAASGAPVVGTVTLKDASATPNVRTSPTAINGSFSFDVKGLTPPFVLTATWRDTSGLHQLFAVAEGPGTANINPFTSAVFEAAADGSDPTSLSENPDPTMYKSIASRHNNIKYSLRHKLEKLFALYGTNQDPDEDDYEADHTRLDALFDDVKITVSHGMVVVTNKETGAVIFTAPVNDIESGTFNEGNMPGQPGQVDGASLYRTNCSSCHDPLATSSVRRSTAAQIQFAIQAFGSMHSLSRLTAIQIQAIATALASSSTPTPSPAPIDSAALYTTDCSSCHGPLATSSKRGTTAAKIQAAISNVGSMNRLSNLTTAQVQAIADALSSSPTPTQPPTPAACTYTYSAWGACQSNNAQTRNLLTSSPAGCAGTPVLSQACAYVPPAPAACTYTYSAWGACQSNNTQTRNLLTSSPAGCTGTPVLSQACAYVTPIDGAALYTQYCSGCHGTSKKGSPAVNIQNAISSNRGGMGSLSSLTSAQIAAIASAP